MSLKKIFCVILIISFIIPKITFAKDNDEEIKVLSKHCICIERTTGQVLFEKDSYTRCAMASTTKILTGLIVIENCNLNDEVIVSKKAANTGGSTLGIREGEKITVESLLYGLLLRSGNDTAVALAEFVSGSVDEFSLLMNNRAKEIGLKSSNFVTPHGLDDDNHFSTAYDMAILTNFALDNETFRRIVNTKQITINVGNNNRILNNTNELLGSVSGVYGVKTGFTGDAGRCLITACKRNNLDIIVVVLGADTKNIRGDDTKKIIDYVFKNFEMIDTKKEIENAFNNFKNTEKIQTLKTLSEAKINYKIRENYICPIDKNKVSKLISSIYCLDKIEAPIKNGTVIGKMRLMCDDKILYEIDIFLDKTIDRITLKEYLKIFVKKYITFYSI